jgi:hypothetical protein
MIQKNSAQRTALTDEDIARYEALKAKIDQLTAEKERLAALIKANLEPGKYKAESDGVTYSVALVESMTSAFNRGEFEMDFPADDFPDLYELSPSSEKIKVALGDDRKVYYGTTVRLTVSKLA